MEKGVNVLHICAMLDGGGIERVIYNQIKFDKSQNIHYFIVKHSYPKGILEDDLISMGTHIEYVTPKSQSFSLYFQQLKKIIIDNRIEVIHCHQGYMSFYPLLIGKIYGVKIRIAHGHTALEPEGIKRKIYRQFNTLLTKWISTYLVSCSHLVNQWMWHSSYKSRIIINGIDTHKFSYNKIQRDSYREKLNLGNKQVIGCVSRYQKLKNHSFLLEIFAEVLKINNNSQLILIGEGEEKGNIIIKIKELGLSEFVTLMPATNDIHKIINAFDCFVLPTRAEGLGIVYIEAQLNGLPTFATKDVVPIETHITSLISYLPLNDAKEWAKEVLYKERRDLTLDELNRVLIFDIHNQVQEYLKLYKEE